jgi:alanyl-tRNA synthetase
MLVKEIRRQFLEYFEQIGHRVVPSSPVVLPHDATLLFANAGMNQFKDVFLGTGSRPFNRAASTQKCIRVSGKHNDLEEVGQDTYHHTFFEMLGNWSFGDYGKQEAITMAWKLLTEVWGLDRNRLYVTIYEGDDEVPRDEEAEKAWRELTDVNPDHILSFGKKDNFWEMGDVGPCGPCSEIHYDRGEDFNPTDGSKCFVNEDCDRFIEIWNLVFIQYSKDSAGKLTQLPQKHVDTGLGLERLAAIMQGVRSNYDIDVFSGIIKAVVAECGIPYTEEQGKPHRVIADHLRTLTFAIGDGVMPSNEGRGYVLRRLLRRAARFGRELSMTEPFIYSLVDSVIEQMGDQFPEIVKQRDTIVNVVQREEELFGHTLDKGLELFKQLVHKVRQSGSDQIAGADAFQLYDTFGFPLDMTMQMAAEAGLQVDENGYREAMETQRALSRQSQGEEGDTIPNDAWVVQKSAFTPEFTGYDELLLKTKIARYALLPDSRIAIVLEKTPFYAESGGQVGDHGIITGMGWKATVFKTVIQEAWTVHYGELKGEISGQFEVTAEVNREYRLAIAANHTATHLLQAALQIVLGKHVHQEGSLVASGHLRFDFSHQQKLDKCELERVEKIINEQIRANQQVICTRMEYDDAIAKGAMALFGEKYDDTVRVIELPGFSMELCGGTHLASTGEVGVFVIRQETAAAQGVRRIEALTGSVAWEYLSRERGSLETIRDLLHSHGSDVTDKLRKTLAEKRTLERELEQMRSTQSLSQVDDLIKNAHQVGEVKLLAYVDTGLDRDTLLKLADALRTEMDMGVVLLATLQRDKPFLMIAVTDSLVSRGVKAGELIREVAGLVGGKGGGKPHLAQAGGHDKDRLSLLKTQGVEILEKQLQQLL